MKHKQAAMFAASILLAGFLAGCVRMRVNPSFSQVTETMGAQPLRRNPSIDATELREMKVHVCYLPPSGFHQRSTVDVGATITDFALHGLIFGEVKRFVGDPEFETELRAYLGQRTFNPQKHFLSTLHQSIASSTSMRAHVHQLHLNDGLPVPLPRTTVLLPMHMKTKYAQASAQDLMVFVSVSSLFLDAKRTKFFEPPLRLVATVGVGICSPDAWNRFMGKTLAISQEIKNVRPTVSAGAWDWGRDPIDGFDRRQRIQQAYGKRQALRGFVFDEFWVRSSRAYTEEEWVADDYRRIETAFRELTEHISDELSTRIEKAVLF